MDTNNNFVKGLNTDILPKYQEDGTYRFALNAVLETELGEVPSMSNEKGNFLCSNNFPDGKVVIGHVLTDSEDVVLFLFDPEGNHEIGLYQPSACNYSTAMIGSCLNFSDKYPINALFRIRNGCERVIYFTDDYNAYRVVNLDQLSDLTEEGVITNCDKIKLFKDYNCPCMNLVVGEGDLGIKDSGGQLLMGTYQFAIRYLDSELNPSNWILTTRPIPIGDEPFNYTNAAGTVNLYDGASNVPTSPYYKPPTNKSIQLQLSQLDFDTYKFYQLAVVKRTGDGGEISGVDVLFPVNIDSATSQYTYTGFDSQVQTTTDLDDILSSLQPVDRVVAHAQTDNRLYIANVTNTSYDWSTFQRYATKIKTEWLKTPIVSPVESFSRQGTFYFDNASFMEDEVYALGIVYVMEDGSFSPVFHIPGRAPDSATIEATRNLLIGNGSGAYDSDNWDTGTTTTYGTGLPASKTKRWQQISTAGAYAATSNRGLMGYHEATSETYPDLSACDGEPYWGTDWAGNVIDSSVKIRHHRMPSSNLVTNAYPDPGTHRVGVRFTNVEYPEGAVRHFFVYGDRTFERSILAKGALIPLPTSAEFATFAEYAGESPLGGSSSFYSQYWGGVIFAPQVLRPTPVTMETSPFVNYRTFAFLCSEGVLKDKTFQPRYFTVEKFLRDTEYGFGLGHNRDVESVTVGKYDDNFSVQTDLWHFNEASYVTAFPDPPGAKVNYRIGFSGKVDRAIYGNKMGSSLYNNVDRNVDNLSFNHSPIIITLEEQINEWEHEGTAPVDQIIYGSLKVDVDPFTNLYNIQYRRMGNCPLLATSTSSAFASYSGDTFVGTFNLTDYSYAQTEEDGKVVEAYHIAFPTQDTMFNYGFRHGSDDPAYSYFRWNYQDMDDGHIQLREHMASKYYEVTDGLMELYPQNPDYNDSYSYLQSIEVYQPLPFNYEFCKECGEAFPYRIYYSEADNGESQADQYRIFRPNNYKDLEGSSGPISDLFVNFNRLYARTRNSLYLLPTRPQQIQSDGGVIYLGTGEVLALPPEELKTSDNAFGGGNYFKARTSTEFGSVYVDDVSGRVFLLTNQLNDISMDGMRNFFQNEGEIKFLKQFYESTSEHFPFLSTSSPSGVGYITWYDPRFKRVLVHKRDFLLLPRYTLSYVPSDEDEAPGSLSDFEVRFNGHSFYSIVNGDVSQVTFDDADFFENKSFTASYSFLTKQWISYHSYLPQYGFHGHRDFFTFNQGLYKHNLGDYTTYYDTKYPHVVDLIAKADPRETKVFTNILYNSKALLYDDVVSTYVPMANTFDSFIAYNSTQSTGLVKIKVKDGAFQEENSNVEAFVRSTDRQYRINEIRDHVLYHDGPLWSSSWADLLNDYYIDKVPYQNNIDSDQSLFDARRMRDHYLGLRLFFKPDGNLKIVTDVVGTRIANRNR